MKFREASTHQLRAENLVSVTGNGCLSYWNKTAPRAFGYMDMTKTALVRAFELARSGKCLNLSELLLRLTAERYDASQIEGPSLRKQLAGLIEVAKRPL